MKICVLLTFLSIIAKAEIAPTGDGSPPANPFAGGNCVELVKGYLSSSEFNSDQAQNRILESCREADTKCVRELGESLRSNERAEAAKFLPLVKACSGRGKGDCVQSIFERTPSFDRASADQAQKLLKKCE